MKIASFLLCSLGVLAPGVQAQPELVSPGQQVLRACANTYKSLREFKGSAAVISQSLIGVNKGQASALLQNADANFDFVRDQHFNITGHDTTHQTFDINSTPQKTVMNYQLGKQQKTEIAEDVEMAVAAFTGVASNAPTTIPALLSQSGWGSPFVVRNDAILRGSETFGGRSCFVVTQKNNVVAETTTFWIDSQSFLLRGMRQEQNESSFPLNLPAGVKAPVALPPNPQMRVVFTNEMHVFSIDKSLPSEDELAAAAKLNPNLPRIENQPKEN